MVKLFWFTCLVVYGVVVYAAVHFLHFLYRMN